MHCALRQTIASAYPCLTLRRRIKPLSRGGVRASAAAEQISLGSLSEGREERIEGIASCKCCEGLGKLPKGGFHKKNPLNPAKLLRKNAFQYKLPSHMSCAFTSNIRHNIIRSVRHKASISMTPLRIFTLYATLLSSCNIFIS